jgi:endo-1,4-beta-xylanase
MRLLELLPAAALLPTAFGQLHKLAKAKGKYFGSATDNYELANTTYKAILADGDEFGQVTPSNLQKWMYSEPTQGVFDFSGGDEIAAFAQQEGIILRCHALVWHSQLPTWGKCNQILLDSRLILGS